MEKINKKNEKNRVGLVRSYYAHLLITRQRVACPHFGGRMYYICVTPVTCQNHILLRRV